MAKQRVERKLAVILAADVAGYSRLMGADEEGTLSRMKAIQRDVIEPTIAEHRGRMVKTTGDGFLVEFASVVEAVRCAAAIQRQVIDRDRAQPGTRRIELRMGVNLGDVIADAGDLHGDGVNVAARLEALAEPGTICLSSAAYEQVRDRVDLVFEDRGEQLLKNIARPVRVWRARMGGAKRRYWVRRFRFRTSRPSQCCRSRTCPTTLIRNTSPTAWSRTSSTRCRISRGCS